MPGGQYIPGLSQIVRPLFPGKKVDCGQYVDAGHTSISSGVSQIDPAGHLFSSIE